MNKILHIFAGRRRAIAAAVVVIAAVMFYAIWNARRSDAQDYPVTDVQRGPLTISLVESGSIQNSRNAIVKNEVPGNTTIIFLIPEGTHVKKGDLLVELDSSQLDDNRTKQQIIVMNAEAAYIRARENLEVVRNQNETASPRPNWTTGLPSRIW